MRILAGILASLVGIGLAVVSVRRLSYDPSALEATAIRRIHPWAIGVVSVAVLAITEDFVSAVLDEKNGAA